MKVVILYSTWKRFDTILNKKVNFGIWNFMVFKGSAIRGNRYKKNPFSIIHDYLN